MKTFSQFKKDFPTIPPQCIHPHVLAERITEQHWNDSFQFAGTCQRCFNKVSGIVHNRDRFGPIKCADGDHLIIEFGSKFVCQKCSF